MARSPSALERLARGLPGLGCLLRPPLPAPPRVDVDRFMGAWYVLAAIPTPLERCAHNAVECYRRLADGSIEVRYRFRAGSADGPYLELGARARVEDAATGARWAISFLPGLWLDYRILHVEPAGDLAVVGRAARDHLWILGRTPELAPVRLGRLLPFLTAAGYDVDRLRHVPQRWVR